jgi:predicted RNase H-like HicB family nuclease
MEKHILNYRVIIEPEKIGKETVYNAYCPTLEVADYGDSVEEVLESIKDGIRLAIDCLLEEKKEVPKDNVNEQLITTVNISANRLIPAI